MSIHRIRGGALALVAALVLPASASAAVPAAPQGVHVSGITSSSLVLSWNAVSGAASYPVYLGGYHSSATSLSFNFTQLSACTRYTQGVRARNSSGSSAWVSVTATTAGCGPPPPPPPPAAPANTSKPTISGTTQQGNMLTASQGAWTGTAPITFTYLWSDGATGNTDMLPAGDVGKSVSVTVTGTNSTGQAQATSAAVGPVTAGPPPPPPPPTSGLHVSGNKLLDANSNVVRLHGVNYSGTEYACVGGYGVFDGHVPTQTDVNGLLAAHVTDLRIPLNEDCWLGINGVAAAYAGGNYQSAIDAWATLLLKNGITPILELHWSAPGSQKATGQQAMPDSDHSPAFWSSVASHFAGRNQIIFDLYNEPYPSSWPCWRDGGSACNGDVSFAVAGMQTLVNAVRGAGATNVITLGCLDYSNTCSGYGGTWTQYRPTDPSNNLVASVHIYIGNPCVNTACWNAEYLPILQGGSPIIDGEWGSYDYNGANYNTSFGTSLLNWFDANQVSGYTAWTWNNWSTWSSGTAEPLIQADDGSVLSTWGQFMSSQYAQRFP